MTTQRARLGAVSLAGALALGGVAALAGPASAAGGNGDRGVSRFSADLDELNDSGTHGIARVTIKDGMLHGKVRVRSAVPSAPHAQHIHFGEEARNECPSLADDENGDGRLSTVDGLPAYGPIVVSFTTSGDTSPASGLAVTRFPVANKQGFYNYNRAGIPAMQDVLAGIRDEQAVVVVHGVDYNGNGVYDFEGAGASELDPSLPAEATDPAACGVLMAR